MKLISIPGNGGTGGCLACVYHPRIQRVVDVREPGSLGVHLVNECLSCGPVVVIFRLTLWRKAAIKCQAVWLPVGQKGFGAGRQAQRIGQVSKTVAA